MTPLRIVSGALDELNERQIVLRGVIDPASLGGLLRPAYQRETLPKPTIEGLMEAFRNGSGRVPDVELAVRGQQYGCADDQKGTYTITGDVYIIDGLQRISAARQCVYDGGKPLIGAMIHFGTTEQWEGNDFASSTCAGRGSPRTSCCAIMPWSARPSANSTNSARTNRSCCASGFRGRSICGARSC